MVLQVGNNIKFYYLKIAENFQVAVFIQILLEEDAMDWQNYLKRLSMGSV